MKHDIEKIQCMKSFPMWHVQPQKMTGGLKFRIWELEGFSYLCSKNKGTDQLHGHRAADLCLCFCMYEKQDFS